MPHRSRVVCSPRGGRDHRLGRLRREDRCVGLGGRAACHREKSQRRVGPVSYDRMERRRRAALQHVCQRGLKHIFDPARADLVHRLQPELEQRTSVGGQNAPVVAHRQLAFVQGVDELGAAVEMQRVGAAKFLIDQPVFDHPRGHAQQHQQVLLHQARTAADIEHGADLARRVEHRHGRTGELRELGEEMIFAAHRHRAGGGQAGAHAVGAGFGFAPHAAGPHAQRPDFGRELGRRDHVHDDPVGVGQHHGRFDIGQLLVEGGHFIAGAVDHVGPARAPFFEFNARDHRRLVRFVRVQPVVVEAAAPRAHDHIVGLLVQAGSHHIHHAIGVPISLCRITQRQRHRCLQFGPAARCGRRG